MRTRVGVTLTHYMAFDGARVNNGAHGRKASDNDTVFLYVLWAF